MSQIPYRRLTETLTEGFCKGVARMLEMQDTGHVHNAIMLYRHTIHMQSYSVDQSEGRLRIPTRLPALSIVSATRSTNCHRVKDWRNYAIRVV